MAVSSSSTPRVKKYDVFLSFRGEDTRNNFTSHLYAALCWRKIETFIDNQLIRGNEISSSILHTIKASKISIIIFSENYASSIWCLQELEHILECKNMDGQIVIPVFYHVNPSNVRNQTGAFGDKFSKLEESFKENLDMLQRWRAALEEAANLSGWPINHETPESVIIDKTLDDILKRLNELSPSDIKELVGVEFPIKKIESLWQIGSNDVCIIGIWGIGGIGKTTIARLVFNKMLRQFEGYYFAENVREESEKQSDLTHLRKELLSMVLQERDPNLGLTFTKERLGRKKVLIVFDDVTSLDQIENLIDLDCLGSGSQIIITTRDKQVLRNCGVDDANIYKVKGLCDNDAYQLFRHYAFRKTPPTKDYLELSKKIVSYTKGLPLALKVLGSSLFSKGKNVWKSVIDKLEIGPPLSIQKVLKVSYDGLEKMEKGIFLDITCFFKGDYTNSVIENLKACYISIEEGIYVLIDKCLITESWNKIIMHDLLQEMGWEIAREEYCRNDFAKQIRLWHHKDIHEVLTKKMGIEAIRSISLDVSKICDSGLDSLAFARMHNLRFFRLYNSQHHENFGNKLDGFEDLESFSNYITFFSWRGYPFKSLPLNFPTKNLVRLDMPCSKVKNWNGVQKLVNLKYVDLNYSKHITEIPNLSRAFKLRELILQGCTSLLEITPSSIQNLNELVNLNLRGCIRLVSLPDGIQSKSIILDGCSNLEIAPMISWKVERLFLSETAIKESPFIEHPSQLVELDLSYCPRLESLSNSICKLKFLENLLLCYCSKLERLPNDFGDLEALEFLQTKGTILKEVPSSILQLKKINYLSLARPLYQVAPINWVHNSSSASGSLKSLCLENCQITRLPDNIGQLHFLERLYLCGNNFESIPENIKELPNLYYMDIRNCERLQSLPELPSGLILSAAHCSSLESISDLSFLLSTKQRPHRISFANCFKLDLWKVLHKESRRDFCDCICFPGNEIPEWFSFQNVGSSITLERLPDCKNKKFLDIILCAVVAFPNRCFVNNYFNVTCDWSMKSKYDNIEVYSSSLQAWGCFDAAYYQGPCSPGHIGSDHVFLGFQYIKDYQVLCPIDEEYWFKMQKLGNSKVLVEFKVGQSFKCEVKKCGIHFVVCEEEIPNFCGEESITRKNTLNVSSTRKKKRKRKEKRKSNHIFKKFKIARFF